MGALARQGELPSLVLAEEVVVEEIYIQTGLDEAADVHDPVVLIVRLVVRAVDPVREVQRSVDAEEEDVVAREILDLSIALQKEELRHNGQGLQVDGEHPEHLEEKARRRSG